jgi:hypothetical protein
LEEKAELRDYVFATDTKTTSVGRLGWSNSTTTPKLCQIFDNLQANYHSALFPRRDFFKFKPGNNQDASEVKTSLVTAYMNNKFEQSQGELLIKQLVLDWCLYGNCFATTEFVREYHKTSDGETIAGYIGPRIIRISPYDIVFDPTVRSFKDSPKVVRSLVSHADIQKPNPELFDRIMFNRNQVGAASRTKKYKAFVADGFGSIEAYYQSPYVEVLTYYGDLYDREAQELKEKRVIKVVDRAYVLSDEAFPSWLGEDAIRHSGWRQRPDNLWAMGPLDNLVGMQYRIDHLENLKADIWDLTAGPMQKIKGDIDDYTVGPFEKVYVGVDGDLEFLTPPPIALNADTQIAILEQKMEEFAGAPRMAMGFRTPGEKTAFEVQTLDNAANRIFNNKARQFEREMTEPLLIDMFEASKRQMIDTDIISVTDQNLSVRVFREITKEDITAEGTFMAVGASQYEETARRVQTLSQMLGVKASQPEVGVHWSGKKMAQILASELEETELFGENVQIEESLETQKAVADAEVDFQEDQQIAREEGL